MGRLGVAVAGLAMAAWLAACSSPAGVDRTPPPSSEAAPELGDFSVADMLAEVPASVRRPGEDFTLYAGDLTQASELGGFDRPATPQEAGVWVAKLAGVGEDGPYPVFVPLAVPLAGSSPAALVDEEFGWSVADVDRFVSYSTLSNITTTSIVTTVAAGDFDENTLAGLHDLSGGVRTAGEGADLAHDLEDSTPGRPGGVPLRMSVDDAWLAASPYTPAVQQWLDGSTDSLADDPVLSGMADLLDNEVVYAAMFTKPHRLRHEELPAIVYERLGFTPADLPRFDTFAIGWGLDDGRPSFTVVYHVPDGVDVQEARKRVGAFWALPTSRGEDIATLVDLHEIRAEGDYVVLTGSSAGEFGADTVFSLQDRQELMFNSR